MGGQDLGVLALSRVRGFSVALNASRRAPPSLGDIRHRFDPNQSPIDFPNLAGEILNRRGEAFDVFRDEQDLFYRLENPVKRWHLGLSSPAA